jgi:hypothetical protein
MSTRPSAEPTGVFVLSGRSTSVDEAVRIAGKRCHADRSVEAPQANAVAEIGVVEEVDMQLISNGSAERTLR